jgi:hypothetical protein
MVVIADTSAVFLGNAPFEVERSPSPFHRVIGAVVDLNQVYCTAMFFLLSGHFVPSSLDRKGLRVFIRDRTTRLGLPAIMWFFGLGPLMVFLLHCAFGLATDYHYNPTMGPEWFIAWLLVLSVVYAFMAQCSKRPRRVRVPGAGGLIAFGLLIGLLQSVLKICIHRWEKDWNFEFYVACFAAGISAKQNGWLNECASFRKQSFRESLGAIRTLSVILAALIIFKDQWQAYLRSFWHAFYANDIDLSCRLCRHDVVLIAHPEKAFAHFVMFLDIIMTVVQCLFGVVMSVVVIDLFRRFCNRGGGSFHRFLTDSMYGVYLFHVPFVHIFSWTYIHLIMEQGLGKNLAFKVGAWCWLHFECPKEVSVLKITISTPIEGLHVWLGWAYTLVLTLVIVFPLAYVLRKFTLPKERDGLPTTATTSTEAPSSAPAQSTQEPATTAPSTEALTAAATIEQRDSRSACLASTGICRTV